MQAVSAGDTAWMLTSTALVIMMTIPGLALFYAGMVRRKNVLSTMVQSFGICCIASLIWMICGYSLAFSTGTSWIGGTARFFLNGLADHFHNGLDSAFVLGEGSAEPVTMTIPESVFLTFQMSFSIIAPAIITGAFAERIKFSALCLFTVLWGILVYAPVAHWVWSPDGWIAGLGAVDFAGGTVVHINAGIAGLVCAIMIGKRTGFKQKDLSPHNLAYAIIGAALLWVGWFGFNAGSAFGANGRAGLAMLTTQIAAASGGVSWMLLEWWYNKKPTALGIISGAVSGLVGITPAAGFVLPSGALWIGLISGAVCFGSVSIAKRKLGYDDSLDAFGIHGVGGIVGAVLTGVLAYGPLSATKANPEGTIGGLKQLISQVETVGVVIIWCVVMTAVIVFCIDRTIGMRVTRDEELEGLDMTQHGERLN
ncbi:ammonium transporter [Aristophania vespae]|uniref:ammonium transporter n=1 Tax=Aristophania vespae TaxID=2697033 RepID=UPI0023515F7A|nr:ammonium transporter [Aristophania vespae]UMM63678.1 Ammonium transporter [Aristophania vespae]